MSEDVNLVPSLLQAIVRIDGEVLVMHPGDKPYVVSPSGQVELASRGLTFDAVSGIVNQLLPRELQDALDDVGAVQYPMPTQTEFPDDRFTVIVARSSSDVWAEIRRRRLDDFDRSQRMPEASFARLGIVPAADQPEPRDTHAPPPAGEVGIPLPSATVTAAPRLPDVTPLEVGDHEELDLPQASHLFIRRGAEASVTSEVDPAAGAVSSRVVDVIDVIEVIEPIIELEAPPPAMDSSRIVPGATQTLERSESPGARALPAASEVSGTAALPAAPVEPASAELDPQGGIPDARPDAFTEGQPTASPSPAVVLPMSRNPIRTEPSPAPTADRLSGLDRLLRTAAARGASTLYLSSDARPSVRVDGQLQILDSEPVHTANDVVSLLLTLMPERSHESLRTGATTEWICDIDDIGRVRCMSFTDHRGPGGVFRLMPVRTVSVEQLGLPREVRSLAIEPEGLVLVAGPRSSGKRTLIAALVDLINRTRRDHVITVEREVNIVHERGSSFVSQREVRGSDDDVVAAARAALREDPDVLVLEQIRTGLLMNVAIEAAASGHLVIGGFSAHNAAEAIDRILDLYAPEFARHVQLALADNLRGVIAQVLLPKVGGGRVAAREVLLNTAAVAGVIAEGKTSQLPMAIEGGRRSGMVPLNDALAGYVQSGMVDIREAYRHVADRPAFVAMLKRQGVDTSAVERLA